MIADMDNTPNAIPTISELSSLKPDDFDLFLHIGDMAYDIDNDSGQLGDDFFQALINVETKIPSLPIAGNHESTDDADMFNYRFRLPGTDVTKPRKNSWYSYDYKNVHFVAIDFDHIYRYRTEDEIKCFKWLK
jgi:acid phosphatase type 7